MARIGRPVGAKSKPGALKTGRKPGQSSVATRLSRMTDAEYLDAKVDLLKLMIGELTGEPMTLSAAARTLKLNPVNVHRWGQTDPDFQEAVRLTRKVVAEDIEAEFRKHPNFIPKMMLLKGYEPMFRDTFKMERTNENLEKMIAELKRLGQKPVERGVNGKTE